MTYNPGTPQQFDIPAESQNDFITNFDLINLSNLSNYKHRVRKTRKDKHRIAILYRIWFAN